MCQNDTKESLQCPARSKRADLGAGYRSMAENLQGFFAIGAFPFDLNQNHLDDGSGLCKTLIKHEASWHKSCKDKINSTKLKRTEKRKICEEPSPLSPRKTRRTSSFGLVIAQPIKKSCAFSAIKLLDHCAFRGLRRLSLMEGFEKVL